MGSPLSWAGFLGLVAALLAADLGIFHRRPHEVPFREAIRCGAVRVGVGWAFNGYIFWRSGPDAGTEFLTAYLVEKSLSVDNVFLFIAIFGALAIPPALPHRVLFWGVLSALAMRLLMIVFGAAALERFHWLVFRFRGPPLLCRVQLPGSRRPAPPRRAMRRGRRP